MTEKPTWEAFFDAHAPIYDENVFTKNTGARAGFRSDGAHAALARRGHVGAQYVGRHSGELGQENARPGRDRDHGRGTQGGCSAGRG